MEGRDAGVGESYTEGEEWGMSQKERGQGQGEGGGRGGSEGVGMRGLQEWSSEGAKCSLHECIAKFRWEQFYQ